MIKNYEVSSIHHFAGENYSRQAGNAFKDEAERISLAKLLCGKWDYTRDGAVLTLEELSKDDVALAVKEREATWKLLKDGNVDTKVNIVEGDKTREILIGASDQLVAFERLYTKNGKVIAPKYRGVYAFRRFSVLVLANALAKKLELSDITEVPAEVKVFSSDKERRMLCVTENTKKNEGVHALDWKDIMSAAYNMFVVGCTQADLRVVFKAGTGQKLWWLLNVNNIVPGIVEQITNGTLKVPLDAMGVKEVYDSLEEQRKELKEGESFKIEDVISDLKGEGQSVKALSMTAVRNIGKNSNVELFKEICTAIATGNADFFASISKDSTKVVTLNDFYKTFKAMK